MKRFLERVLDLLYPPKCIFCHRLLQPGEVEICNRCRLKLPICDVPPEGGPFLSGCTAVFYYEEPVRASMLRFKFGGNAHYAEAYGKFLALAAQTDLPVEKIDAVTWVPVSKQRRRKRGYDQARLVAETVAGVLGKPLESTLVKIRDNRPQSSLEDPAARKANVLGAYRPARADLTGKTFLLIDDIYTTGATLGEAARVLLTAGAAAIYGAAVAAKRNDGKQG